MPTTPVIRKNTVVSAPPGEASLEVASVIVGSSLSNEVTVTATGLGGNQYNPGYVFLQARQSNKGETSFPDKFALQVIELSGDSVTFRVKRLDGAGGWSQLLQVDILLVPFTIIP